MCKLLQAASPFVLKSADKSVEFCRFAVNLLSSFPDDLIYLNPVVSMDVNVSPTGNEKDCFKVPSWRSTSSEQIKIKFPSYWKSKWFQKETETSETIVSATGSDWINGKCSPDLKKKKSALIYLMKESCEIKATNDLSLICLQ